MRIKDGYALRKVADTGVVVPLDEMDCNQLMTLNQSGIDLWEMLLEDTDMDTLVKTLTDRYEVSEETAARDIRFFLDKLSEAGLLDE